MTAMGYRNVMWGSGYPHMEGTFGHTQETLCRLFDSLDDDVCSPRSAGLPHFRPPDMWLRAREG